MGERVTVGTLDELREAGCLTGKAGSQPICVFWSEGEPFALEPTGSIYDLARDALSTAFEHAAVEVGMGGTVPFIAEFARTFPGATVVISAPTRWSVNGRCGSFVR